MPWNQRSPMDLKMTFISDYLRRVCSIAELCRNFGISRKTGYKWISRYSIQGSIGLCDRSRRPRKSPTTIAEKVVQLLVEARRRHPTWGPKKLLVCLSRKHRSQVWPSNSTVSRILKTQGLVTPRRRRPRAGHPGKPLSSMNAPNDVWTADFKGKFFTGDRRRCFPLTIGDGCTRFALEWRGLLSPDLKGTWKWFIRVFKEYGLPLTIRTDNGPPFAGRGLARLSFLSLWWISLGITPELIELGRPDQNARHERMHRTLKQETASPPAWNLSAQQRRFNEYRHEYNYERPHEGLGQRTPGSLYRPSTRAYSGSTPAYEYPLDVEIRWVESNGAFSWKGRTIKLTRLLAHQHIALRATEDGWDVLYRFFRVGILRERTMLVEDPYRSKPKVLPMS